MKKTKAFVKLTGFLLAGFMAFTNAGAQEFDSDWSDSDSSFGDSDFSSSWDFDSDSGSAFSTSANLSTDIRYYFDGNSAKDGTNIESWEDFTNLPVEANPSANVTLGYSGNKVDAEVTFNINADTISDYPEDIIDELLLRSYFGDNLILEVGKMKTVWGKGDKLHVFDNFNADNYTDFIIPDYNDRRIATPMVRASYAFPFANLNVEAVYTPFLPVDRFNTDGRWTPAQASTLKGKITNSATTSVAEAFTNYTTLTATVGTLSALGADYQAAVTAYQKYVALTDNTTDITSADYVNMISAKGAYEAALQSAGYASVDEAKAALTSAATSYMYALNAASALSADSSSIYPDTNLLQYGQFGVRGTFTLGVVDLGASYYYGHYKQPSFNEEKYSTWISDYMAGNTPDYTFLSYDRKQTFALESSFNVWKFGTRWEVCYNLTDDLDGSDPYIHNNSIGYLGGFDIDLPFWNANLNVQETGLVYLYGDKINSNNDAGKTDVDYNVNGASNNKLVVNFSTSFVNDKIAPELTVMYGFENADLVIMPKVTLRPSDTLTFTASGLAMWCRDENSEFYAWKDNSFVSLAATINF